MAEEERQDEQQEKTPAEESPESAEEQPPEAEPPAEEEAPAAEEAPAEQEEAPAAERKDEKEAVPGAELEPIAIEEERELSAEERARREAEAEERARREAEATEETGEEPAPTREPAVALEGDVRVKATGKRKSSVARVIVLPGSGRFEVNRRELDEYFPRPFHRTMARQPLVTTGYEGNVDVRVRVHGGGVSGQAGAVRHGVARALCEIDPELRGELKRRGLLTRDARRKERRKAGLKKARKRPQFSKR
jgi:small subunit ribosomal protein S9